jgi:hypothetical protein
VKQILKNEKTNIFWKVLIENPAYLDYKAGLIQTVEKTYGRARILSNMQAEERLPESVPGAG